MIKRQTLLSPAQAREEWKKLLRQVRSQSRISFTPRSAREHVDQIDRGISRLIADLDANQG